MEAIDLKSISLRGTKLRYANLTGADLRGAGLSSAILLRERERSDRWYCVCFDGADLREAKVDLSYIDKAGLALYV